MNESIDLQLLRHRIENIALFRRVGLAVSDLNNPRIGCWEDWVGPEDPGSMAIALRQQELHDALIPSDTETNWLMALQTVVDQAAALVPYDPTEDAWHAPTIAVWSAAWSFSLEALYARHRFALPADIATQIIWYERGHWPCALVAGAAGSELKDYVIF